MRYYIDIPRPIRRWVDKRCPGSYRQRIKRAIQSLSSHPRPEFAEPLRSPLEDFLCLHIDNYRIIYKVDDEAQVIKIAFIGIHGTKPYSELNLMSD